MKNWDLEGMVYMMNRTCDECERLWEAYERAAQCHLIIERKSIMETGLEALVQKAFTQREERRKTVLDHEATHIRAMATAGSGASNG